MGDENLLQEATLAVAETVAKEGVNKISNVLAGFFPFWGTKKVAVSTYINEIQNSDLSPEAKLLAIANAKATYKRLNNQAKIAEIAYDSAKEGTDFSETSIVDDEWLERFFDSAKFVSDENMQVVWGRILAGEFDNPGTVPPRIIRVLSEITSQYANIFANICCLSVEITPIYSNGKRSTENCIIIPEITNDDNYLSELEITFSNINELSILGLVSFASTSGYRLTFDEGVADKAIIKYGEKATTVSIKDNSIPIGTVLLTEVGEHFQQYISTNIINQHYENVLDYIKKQGVLFEEETK
jgi:hypothetical protein